MTTDQRFEEMIQYLPEYMRSDDAMPALRGLIIPIVVMETYLELRKGKLPRLLDPALCPDEQVPYLAGLVGVGYDLPASNLASIAELRRLIAVAMMLWRKKGTTDSLRALGTAIARSRTLIFDYFYLRTADAEYGEMMALPMEGTTVSSSYDYPEYILHFWYGDPYSTANTSLLHAFLSVVRPMNERYNVYKAWLVDDLQAGTALWAGSGAGTGSYSADTFEITSLNGWTWLASVGGIEASWESYLVWLRMAVTGVVDLMVYHYDSENYYFVRLDSDAQTAVLYRRSAGIEDVLVVDTPVTFAAGFAYRWRIEVYTLLASTELRVFIEAREIFTHIDTDANRLSFGRVGWRSSSGGGTNSGVLSAATVYPDGLTPTRIGPNP